MEKQFESISTNDIVSYYDQCEIDYRWLWHLKGQNAMHYGLWYEDTSTLREALYNMNNYIVDLLKIRKDQWILDAGCGVGGTVLHICQSQEVVVHGITLSRKQVEKCKRNAENSHLKGRAIFSMQDYCNTSFEPESFDAIYAIESVCHAHEKMDYLKEAYRILKPGGIAIIADFFTTQREFKPRQARLLDNWARSWAVPSFENKAIFMSKCNEAGFDMVGSYNITENIFRSSKRLKNYFYPGLIAHSFLYSLGLRNKIQGKNVWSTYYQHKSLQQKLWEYRVLKLQKN
ncbi:MAG TPA: class I SAM-dependent methyltransferase [Saprospiraceae bacterium]|nr:class I SAM-dependent methyltransferase [Saprospiraceae bacterium]